MVEGLNEDIVFLRFDPYLDSRSIYLLASNAYGSQSDIRAKNALNDEDRYDSSFNAIYETASSINDDGYTVEFLIPFSSIPHPKGKDKVWGFNVTRYFTIDGNGIFTISDKYDRDNPCRICQITTRININDIDEEAKKYPIVTKVEKDITLNSIMSNSFGFGGTNATLVFEKV